MVYAFPEEKDLWARYAEIRAESLRNDGGGREATEFYRAHREAMDAGAVVAWPERHNEDELSAIQHAMNLKLQDEAAFWAEYQNEPLPEDEGDADMLTADDIAAKTNGLPRGEVPVGCDHVTMFIDVQQKLLFFAGGGLGERLHRLRGRLRHLPRPEAALLHAARRAAHAGQGGARRGAGGLDLRRAGEADGDSIWPGSGGATTAP